MNRHICSLAIIVAASLPAKAVAQDARRYDIAEQDIAGALRAFAAVSGRDVSADSALIAGKRSRAVRGTLTADQALAVLLAGSGLRAEQVAGVFIVRRAPDPAAAEAGDNAIVVTGTRIRGAGPVGSAVTALDRDDIERSGYATTQDIAQTIPQNFGGAPNEATAAISLDPLSARNLAGASTLNLRGLGAGSTLVLINGDRPPLGGFGGLFSDISVIPASAVERIEVIADGASAIYGSDAVAGVVNIIPRTRFDGIEAGLRFATADGDSEDYVASLVAGKRWSSGHVVVAYEFYRRTALAAADRSYVTDDLTRFGGPDLRDSYANPGTILAGGRTFAIPAGQDGTGLRPSDLAADQANRGDGWALTDILPRQTRHSLYAFARQELSSTVSVYAQGLYASRRSAQRLRTSINMPHSVPVSNPFYVDPIGSAQPILVQYDFGRDLGRERNRGSVDAVGLTLGTAVTFGDWSIDVRGNHGRQDETSRLQNRVNSARLAVALADPDSATAYNLFGDGPNTNPATIDFTRGSSRFESRARVWSAALRADGPLVSLPAGDVRAAIGTEYRRERYQGGSGISDTRTLLPVRNPNAVLPGPRKITALYGELLVPLAGDGFNLPGLRRLDLSAALRSEHYNDVGTTTNPKFGLLWEPVSGLRLRGTWSTSFRAPAIDNLRLDPASVFAFAFTIPDPASPTGRSNVLVQGGNDPDLGPERATSWTLGADIEPVQLRGFRAGLTYYNIVYRDRISSPGANLFNFLVNRDIFDGIIEDNPSPAAVAAIFASPGFLNPFILTPDAITASIDARLQNLSVVRQSGLDVSLDYDFDLLGGRASLGASGTYIFRIDQAITDTAPSRDVVDVLGNPVDLRVRGRAGWSNASWTVSAFVNYLDSYTNLTNVTPERVRSATTVDAQLAYRIPAATGLLSGLRVAISATNIFDRRPPYAAYNLGIVATGYDPDNASPLGRVVSLQLTKSW
jgi:iron complex outermembrane recepter protein